MRYAAAVTGATRFVGTRLDIPDRRRLVVAHPGPRMPRVLTPKAPLEYRARPPLGADALRRFVTPGAATPSSTWPAIIRARRSREFFAANVGSRRPWSRRYRRLRRIPGHPCPSLAGVTAAFALFCAPASAAARRHRSESRAAVGHHLPPAGHLVSPGDAEILPMFKRHRPDLPLRSLQQGDAGSLYPCDDFAPAMSGRRSASRPRPPLLNR